MLENIFKFKIQIERLAKVFYTKTEIEKTGISLFRFVFYREVI